MRSHQHDIDELARMERLCRELAEQGGYAGGMRWLACMANNYRAEISDRERDNRFANTVPTRELTNGINTYTRALPSTLSSGVECKRSKLVGCWTGERGMNFVTASAILA